MLSETGFRSQVSSIDHPMRACGGPDWSQSSRRCEAREWSSVLTSMDFAYEISCFSV